MQKYHTFTFVSFACLPEEGRIELEYALRDPEGGGEPGSGEPSRTVDFVETLTFPEITTWDGKREDELNQALFLLHLIGGISYYKTCLPKNIEVGSGKLTEAQAEFWKTVYENGLGEFYFKNKIDVTKHPVNFPALAKNGEQKPFIPPETGFANTERCLVPIGGGKDSLVTIKLLQKQRIPVTLLRIGSHPLITAQAVALGLPVQEIKRGLSPRLFELNEQGALNGHVPITAYLNMLAVVLAILRGDSAVVFSNERSANEGNVEYLGRQINHQWSKSLEFERMLQEQVRSFSELEIFSLLRPLSELHITKIFTGFPQYLPLATSCNDNWKILAKNKKSKDGLYCGNCPKCAFVFALFDAFLPHQEVVTLFNKDLYADEALLPMYRELLGLEGFKPFECVGTSDETKAAFLLAHERGDAEDTAVMKFFVKDVLPKIKDPKALVDDALKPSPDHAVPERFQNIVTSH